MENKFLDWSLPQEFEYEGKTYEFDPYYLGMGGWTEKTLTRGYKKKISLTLQVVLNKFAFGKPILPNIGDRIIHAVSSDQRQRLLEISSQWLFHKMNLIKTNSDNIHNSERPNLGDIVNNMYFYEYDPKWKEILPRWDRFPLVIILDLYHDGFLGLNLHYLDTGARLKFLQNALGTNKDVSTTRKMQFNISYEKLKSSKRGFKNYDQCLKRYLLPHIQTRMLKIDPYEWGLSVNLPVEEFHEGHKAKNK